MQDMLAMEVSVCSRSRLSSPATWPARSCEKEMLEKETSSCTRRRKPSRGRADERFGALAWGRLSEAESVARSVLERSIAPSSPPREEDVVTRPSRRKRPDQAAGPPIKGSALPNELPKANKKASDGRTPARREAHRSARARRRVGRGGFAQAGDGAHESRARAHES